jgi:hypothetical protein
MASRPWSSRELAVLELHVGEPDWLRQASAKISGRSIAALKVRMARIRSGRTAGGRGDPRSDYADGRIVAGDCGDDDDGWMGDAAVASEALLAATLRVGRWA